MFTCRPLLVFHHSGGDRHRYRGTLRPSVPLNTALILRKPRAVTAREKETAYSSGSDQFSSDSFTLCKNWCAMAPSTTR